MIDDQYLIQCMFKTALEDKQYLTTITTSFEPEYFGESVHSEIFKFLNSYLREFKQIPQKEIIINSIPSDIKNEAKSFFEEIDSIDYDSARNYNWLLENTNVYLKDKAIKKAIIDSVDIIDEKGDINRIKSLIENALCKDIKIDLGLDYWNQLGERLQRIFTATDNRIPSYYPQLDEYLNGGFPPFTLSVWVARVHGFKSNIMANIISRQVLAGHNVGLCTLEMSEDMFAQRFDSIYSMLDINRIYINKKLQKELIKTLKELKERENRGNLFIKSYPTGAASTANFRIWLRELAMRDVKPNILYCDYINLMKPEYKSRDSLYTDVKRISEELRAIGFEFNIPVVSVSQLNRSGTFMSFDEVDMNSIAESLGVPATADFMAIMGGDEESMVYESEVAYKIVKNRLGGRIGTIDKFYYDDRSLKMYDSTELDIWIEDAKRTGSNRNLFEKTQ